MALGVGTIGLRLGISMGGTSGLAKVLHNVIPLPISVFVYILNILLFVMAFFLINKEFAMKTIVSSFIFPLFFEVAQNITVFDVLSSDLFLASIIGGALIGTGCGMVLRGNGSSGGFDILAVVIYKYFNIQTAITLCICDMAVLCLQINLENVLTSIYGIVMILMTSTLVNKIVTKGTNEVKMMIFTNKSLEIKDLLLKREDCGLTLLKAESGYRNQTMDVIVSIMPYDKVQSCKTDVLTEDPEAFIVLEDVQAAYTGNYRLRKPEDYIIK